MPNLSRVSREWEQCEEIRSRLRESGQLLVLDCLDNEDPKISINNAVSNFDVLKPLARLLLDSDGNVGMHNVGPIKSQFLARCECVFSFL